MVRTIAFCRSNSAQANGKNPALSSEVGDRAHHHHAARVRLHLLGGRVVETTVEVAKGDAANPLAPSFLEEKFLRLSAGHLTGNGRLEMLQFLKQLQLKDDLRFMLDAIRVPGCSC